MTGQDMEKLLKGEIVSVLGVESVAVYCGRNTKKFIGLIVTEAGDYQEYCSDIHIENVLDRLNIWLNEY